MSGCIFVCSMDPNKDGCHMTEDELHAPLWQWVMKRELLRQMKRTAINNVFDLDDSVAGDIMVPRVNMTFIDITRAMKN